MSLKPSCFTPANYDPYAPLRSPLSRRSSAECVDDMVVCMQEILANHGTGIVDEHDLMRAGFTPGEIERHRGEAVAALAQRLRPAGRRAA